MHRFVIDVNSLAVDDGGAASQVFELTVGAAAQVSSVELPTELVETLTFSVDEPSSPLHGVGLVMPLGLVLPISDVGGDQGLVLPISNVAGSAALPGYMGDANAVVDIGPNGTTFADPVGLVLPISNLGGGELSAANVEAWSMGMSGSWEPINIVGVDTAAGTLMAEISHFSQFTAIARPKVMASPALRAGGERCADALFVQAGLGLDPVGISGRWFNGYDDARHADTLAGVLDELRRGEQVTLVLRAALSMNDGSDEIALALVVTARRSATSGIDVIIADADGGVLLARTGLDSASSEAYGLLSAPPLNFVFRGVGDVRGKAKVELALARGKRDYDRRHDIARRDAKREMEHALKERTRS